MIDGERANDDLIYLFPVSLVGIARKWEDA